MLSEKDQQRLQIINEPVPYGLDELFFSRTDERGIILSGNEIFQRISLYEWEELLNKPHNVIRHPHMPKAVFWLLWDTIKRGEPIGAYVKNRAKDGRYYWVFAIITPVDGQYLSVRIKPSSELMPVVESAYADLVHHERESGCTPEESAHTLLGRLKELGFSDYTSFMAHALSAEIAAQRKGLDLPPDQMNRRFDVIAKSAGSLLTQADQIYKTYIENQYVPLNLQIQAAQLGNQGVTISVISNNYSTISVDIKNNLDQFMEASQDVFTRVTEGLFLLCVSKVQNQILGQFEQEDVRDEAMRAQDMRYLEEQQATYQQKAIAGLQSIVSQAEAFRQVCHEMKQLASSLEVTRMMGKVEAARLDNVPDGLLELIDDLDIFQSTVSAGFKEMDKVNLLIKKQSESVIQACEAAA